MQFDHDRSLDYRQFPVLYVDDETSNLRTFELAFRRDFTVVKAESGVEALARLASEPIAVVLSDHRMPGMTGTELLARVREIAPRTIRLLVTAYGDAATLAQAINDGCIYRYVPKPWDPDEMRAVVRQAIDLYSLESQKDTLISELATLNTVSQTIAGQLEMGPLVKCLQRTVVDDLGFDGASVMLRSEARDALWWHSSHPSVDDLSGQGVVVSRVSSPSFFDAVDRGEACLLQLEREFEGSSELRALMARVAAEEVLVLPLHGRRGLIGVFAIDNRRGGRRFSARDQHLLRGLAAQAATAIDNAQIVGELRNDAARTSGSDALAIASALGESLSREVGEALEESGVESASAMTMGDISAAVAVFSEILSDQRPTVCDLADRARAAGAALSRGANACQTTIRIESSAAVKVGALPGRLTQLLLHLLELNLLSSSCGAVVVTVAAFGGRGVAEVASVPGRDLGDSVGRESDRELVLLRIAACEALAREIGGSLELSLEGEGRLCRMSVPLAE